MKLIAEPWDVGEGGYQVGNFPVALVGVERQVPRRDARVLARRRRRRAARSATGSPAASDLYEASGRSAVGERQLHHRARRLHAARPRLATTHKHNEANGEDNRDGTDDDASWNCGVEGPTDDAEINALRARQKRNFLATLLLSQGTPMLLGGDEIGRTQRGNNNAYCQDNEISWVDWSLDDEQRALLEFTQRLLRLRRDHPALPPREVLPRPADPRARASRTSCWFRHDGEPDDGRGLARTRSRESRACSSRARHR